MLNQIQRERYVDTILGRILPHLEWRAKTLGKRIVSKNYTETFPMIYPEMLKFNDNKEVETKMIMLCKSLAMLLETLPDETLENLKSKKHSLNQIVQDYEKELPQCLLRYFGYFLVKTIYTENNPDINPFDLHLTFLPVSPIEYGW